MRKKCLIFDIQKDIILKCGKFMKKRRLPKLSRTFQGKLRKNMKLGRILLRCQAPVVSNPSKGYGMSLSRETGGGIAHQALG